MKKSLILAWLLPVFLYGQEGYNKSWVKKIPVLTLSDKERATVLPYSVDNSGNLYFPGVMNQGYTPSCQQYSSVTYCFGYEMSRARNVNGADPANIFPALYTFNYMYNDDNPDGVSFFYSWDVMKHQGHPVSTGYDPEMLGMRGWLSGYDQYYEGMKNRVGQVNQIPVNTDEGILTLKHYLYDHLNGTQPGGFALFTSSPPFGDLVSEIPAGTPEAGKPIVAAFYPLGTHGLTIVGYNDSIRVDVNNDGQFTNTIDLNNDGKISPADYEYGAYRVVNSYGREWYDSGFIWVMYRALALDFFYDPQISLWLPNYGAWNNSVFTVDPVIDYEPLLTVKTSLGHTSREMIAVKAGISSNPGAETPEHIMDFMIWNHQGGTYPVSIMHPWTDEVEAGFDITPLLSYVNPGDSCKVFLLVDEQDDEHIAEGMINEASIMTYFNGNAADHPAGSGKAMEDNSMTILSSTIVPDFSKPAITTTELPPFTPLQDYSVQLQAAGGKPPYQWSVLHPAMKMETDSVFPADAAYPAHYEGISVPYHRFILPFPFSFYGKSYDTVYMNAFGFLCFTPDAIPDYYISEPEQVIRNYPVISAAYSFDAIIDNPNSGMWYREEDHRMTFRWKVMMSHSGWMNMAVRLYDDGRFEILYGECAGTDLQNVSSSGHSAGDDNDFSVWTNWKPLELTGKSYLFIPASTPDSVRVSQDGELTASGLDGGKIYEVMVNVKDENQISGSMIFSLGNDLMMEASLSQPVTKNEAIPVTLKIKNTGSTVPLQIQ